MQLFAGLKKLLKAGMEKIIICVVLILILIRILLKILSDMTKIGKELSVEPVVGIDEPYVLTEADLPVLYEEYDKLARAYLAKAAVKAMLFVFSIFNVALDNGPCVAKRLAGCGAGHEYFAITPEGRHLSMSSVCRQRRIQIRNVGNRCRKT